MKQIRIINDGNTTQRLTVVRANRVIPVPVSPGDVLDVDNFKIGDLVSIPVQGVIDSFRVTRTGFDFLSVQVAR